MDSKFNTLQTEMTTQIDQLKLELEPMVKEQKARLDVQEVRLNRLEISHNDAQWAAQKASNLKVSMTRNTDPRFKITREMLDADRSAKLTDLLTYLTSQCGSTSFAPQFVSPQCVTIVPRSPNAWPFFIVKCISPVVADYVRTT